MFGIETKIIIGEDKVHHFFKIICGKLIVTMFDKEFFASEDALVMGYVSIKGGNVHSYQQTLIVKNCNIIQNIQEMSSVL